MDLQPILQGMHADVSLPITRLQDVPESFEEIEFISLRFKHRLRPGVFVEFLNEQLKISENVISVVIPDTETLRLAKGEYDLDLLYKKTNVNRPGGYEPYRLVTPAFQIVSESDKLTGVVNTEINIQTITIAGQILISRDGTNGASAFDIWKHYYGNETSTIEEYFSWVQQPANDAAAYFDLLVANFNEFNAAAVSSEQLRQTNESLRNTNEDARIVEEQLRKTKDLDRDLKEQERQLAEVERETLFDQMVDESTQATYSANTAASNANTAAGAQNTYNITAAIPLSAGSYYTKTTARAAVPAVSRKLGLVITYATADKIWYSEKYIGTTVAGWTTESNWEQVPDAAKLTQFETDLNEKVKDICLGGEVTFSANNFNNSGRYTGKSYDSSPSYVFSNFIQISEGYEVKANVTSGGSTGTNVITLFDINKNVILYVLGSSVNSISEYSVIAPYGCYYAVIGTTNALKYTSNYSIKYVPQVNGNATKYIKANADNILSIAVGGQLTVKNNVFTEIGRYTGLVKDTSASYRSTPVLEISALTEAVIKSFSGGSTGTNMITFLDSHLNVIDYVGGSTSNTLIEYKKNAPSNSVYVVFSTHISGLGVSNYQYLFNYTGIIPTEQKISIIENDGELEETFIISGTGAGTYQNCSINLDASVSGLHYESSIKGFDRVKIAYPSDLPGSSRQTIITDANDAVLLVAQESYGEVILNLPLNAEKIYASSGRPNTLVTLYKNSKTQKLEGLTDLIVGKNPLDKIKCPTTFVNCFQKIYFIGDSLTEGVFNTTTGVGSAANMSCSLPVYFKKHTGVEVYNAGIGSQGASMADNAYSWYYQATHDRPLATYDNRGNLITEENIGDCIVIYLGTNDVTRNGFDGNVETDIDLLNKENNAITAVGGYAYIIQTMREFRPKAPIFCVTISNDRHQPAQLIPANNKIRAIAAKFENTYIIDLEKYAETTINEQIVFSKFLKNSSHNNALGYSMRAKQYATYMDWIIYHNVDKFRNIQFILTNDDYDV